MMHSASQVDKRFIQLFKVRRADQQVQSYNKDLRKKNRIGDEPEEKQSLDETEMIRVAKKAKMFLQEEQQYASHTEFGSVQDYATNNADVSAQPQS